MASNDTIELEERSAREHGSATAKAFSDEVELQLKLIRGQGFAAAEFGTDELVAILGLANSDMLRKRGRERYPFLRVEGKSFCATALEVARYLAAKSVGSQAQLGALAESSLARRG